MFDFLKDVARRQPRSFNPGLNGSIDSPFWTNDVTDYMGRMELLFRSGAYGRTPIRHSNRTFDKARHPENRLKSLQSELRTVRRIKNWIMQETETNQLIQGIADILTEALEYSSVCIVLLDDDEEIVSVAGSGFNGYTSSLEIQIKQGNIFQCMQRAVGQPDFLFSENCNIDCTDCVMGGKCWYEKLITLKLEKNNRVLGYISATLPKESARDGEAESLLRDFADDITMALHHQTVEAGHQRLQLSVKRDLKEKALLLKEIHHRVKNNLQIICSLISIQSSSTENKTTIDALTTCQRRIRTMSMIHEKLYKSNDFSRIDFKLYVSDLVEELKTVYHINTDKVFIGLDVEHIALSLDQAIPCGLIINELIANALKHAFPAAFDRTGIIHISMSQDEQGEVSLIVTDNGSGLPEHFDLENTKTSGLEIVKVVAESQLKGEVKVEHSQGARFTVQFSAGKI